MVSSQKKLTWSGHIIWTSTVKIYEFTAFYGFTLSRLAGKASLIRSSEMDLEERAQKLEHQYVDYKNEFYRWTEANKSNVGTPAYQKYVEDFEAWERKVKQQREELRTKIEQEKMEEKYSNVLVEEQRREAVLKQLETDAAEYEKSQKNYLAYHKSALEAEERASRELAKALESFQAQKSAYDSSPALKSEADPADGEIDTVDFFCSAIEQSIANFSADQSLNDSSASIQASTPQTVSPFTYSPIEVQTPPAVPFNVGPTVETTYGESDSMWAIWGPRAAPPNHQFSRGIVHRDEFTPGWMLLREMKERRLAFRVSSDVPPPRLPRISSSSEFLKL
ncbi:hypothetical protein L596_029263 [Steinernema carpocapsae]|uniref:Uncharacterized protein n=1 Tax=Steinernema carpocapsae TaxID=34508 RepID=A0A4U5LU44_STECR|nr:hypothetical protein L596_029263 [Steinernema carpocapsae]